MPGRNSATLTLANGKKILLSDVINGELAKEAGVTITKTRDGQVVYSTGPLSGLGPTKQPQASMELVNTLSTANGEQYQVILPDQSKVWLNAASSIKFPLTFFGKKERQIELTGEAYFIVKHNARQPFKVRSKGQIVEDIGTEFNINAYADEAVVKTTLIEGAARVTLLSDNQLAGHQLVDRHPGAGQDLNAVVLTSGKQAQLKINGTLEVAQVDTEEAVSWQKGYFLFANEDIKSVMRKISRWYNIKVIYQGNTEHKAIGGTVSKYQNVTEVLNMLNATKAARFTLEGKIIIVTPYQ